MIIQTKKGWIPRDFMVAALLFSGVVGFFVFFMAGLAAEYDQPDLVSSSFSQNYDQLGNVSAEVATMFSSISTGQVLSLVGAFDIAFTATFTIIQLLFSTLVFMGALPGLIIVDFTFVNSLVVANFFVLALSIVTTIIVFTWISSVRRGKI